MAHGVEGAHHNQHVQPEGRLLPEGHKATLSPLPGLVLLRVAGVFSIMCDELSLWGKAQGCSCRYAMEHALTKGNNSLHAKQAAPLL